MSQCYYPILSMVELVSNGTNSNTVQTCQIFWIVKNSIKIIPICSQTMNEDVPLRYNGVPKTSAVVLDFRKKGRQLLLVANYLDRMIVPKDFLSRKESVVG